MPYSPHITSSLSNETGGILLGYFDYKIKALYLVEALAAPPDSKEEKVSFIRGKSGMPEMLTECFHRTANIVQYIGEWHSHPDGVSPTQSSDDVNLLKHLSESMAPEGASPVIAIVGERSINFLCPMFE
jgi:integrative and conjugative element protein (TIGR02256 family)